MKFFIPDVQEPKEAENWYQAIKKFAEDQGWKVTDRRIHSLTFRDQGQEVKATVGQTDPVTGETVWAILESSAYLVCTWSRGVKRGNPVLVGTHEGVWVTDFEG